VIGSLADEAVVIAEGTPSFGLFRAQAVRASIAARRTDHWTALAELDEFTRTFENLPTGSSAPDAASGLADAGLGPAFLAWHQAYVRTHLGDAQAMTSIDLALRLYPVDLPGPIALLSLMRAADLVRTRNVQDGISEALSAMRGGPTSTARRHLAGQVLSRLPQDGHRVDGMRELRELAARQ